MIQKFLEINLCNDINFKYVLGKETSKKEKIQSLMKKQKEIHMLVECTDEIQRSEKEWLEDFNQRRMEHNKASQKARWKEEVIKETKKADILAVSKYMTLDQIAEAFHIEVSYVQSIIDSQNDK